MIEFATKESIKQPTGSLTPMMGGFGVGVLNVKQALSKYKQVGDGHYANVTQKINNENQRLTDGDTFGCTGFADNNQDEILFAEQHGEVIDISDKFVVVGDGTQPNVGNSMDAPATFKEKKGFVFENEYPFSNSETLQHFYQPIGRNVYDLAATRVPLYERDHDFVSQTDANSLVQLFKISPLKVAVQGHYVFDENNRIMNIDYPYNHAIVLFDFVLNPDGTVLEFWGRCSETAQYLKIRGDYKFESPMIKKFKKKIMTKLFRKAGQRAIGFLDVDSQSLILFADGAVTGGQLFKDFGFTYEMAQEVPEWPYPVKMIINTELYTGAASQIK